MSGFFEQAKSKVCLSEGTHATMRPLVSTWEQRKLSSIAASFDYGLNAAATEYDGKNKYLRITDIDDATHEFLKSDLTTPLADLAMSADYLLEEGDLLFARTGASVGKTYLYRQYDGTVYFAGFLIRARIEESADPEFVYQTTLTDAYKKFVAITSQRSGQPGVNAQEYADYQLMLPSRTEQQQIGMTLRSLDNLITLHQRKYDKLCTVKKSMLDKMFPKPGETEPEIRFEGFTDPWEQRKLGELIQQGGSGGTPSANNPDYYGGDIPFLSIADISGRDITNTAKTLTDEGLQNSAAWIVPSGAVSLAMYASVGKVGIIRQDAATSQAFYNMVFENEALRDFVFTRLEKAETDSEWEPYISTGTQRNLNADKVKSFSLDVPSNEEASEISAYFANLDTLITLHQRKLDLLKNTKKSLLDKMFV